MALKELNNKKGEIHFTTGLVIRLAGALIISVSLPFLVENPTNIFPTLLYGFGNFVLVVGGVIK